MPSPLSPAEAQAARVELRRLHDAIRLTIRGKDEVIDQILVCLLAGGHVLMEDAPGVGKTTLAYALARGIECAFSRIQFTSDLLPSDVTGISIYDERSRAFQFKPGPIFAHIVLADEINRATPKTQSALLEVMDRARVTVDGQAHQVGSPFLVFATQNPLDDDGTFPLPESQLDRFLMRLHMGYPSEDYERQILAAERTSYDAIATPAALHRDDVLRLQGLVTRVFVEDSVNEGLLRLVRSTREDDTFRNGISVRGGLALRHAAQARALLHGREFVTPADVAALAVPAFVHRMRPRSGMMDTEAERRTVTAVIEDLVAKALPAA